MNADVDENMRDMGCSEADLKEHINRLKMPEMKWEEFGYKWHIVQRIQLHDDNPSETSAERLKQICHRLHYSNTVPVWHENVRNSIRGSLRVSAPSGPATDKKAAVVPVYEEKVDTVTLHDS